MAGSVASCVLTPEPGRPRQPVGQEASLDVEAATSPLPEPSATMPAEFRRPNRAEINNSFAGKEPTYWGLGAPGVLTKLPVSAKGVALTFDFCGGPGGNGDDAALLRALRGLGTPATLFLNSRWIAANPVVSRDLANDPQFELGNHGTLHLPLSVNGKSAYGIPGTKGPAEIYDEIMGNMAGLEDLTGNPTRFFRAGTAYLDNVAAEIVRALGLIPVGFSINGDGGATFPAATVSREVGAATHGDIVIAHGNHPGSGTAAGLVPAVKAMQQAGLSFVHISADPPEGAHTP